MKNYKYPIGHLPFHSKIETSYNSDRFVLPFVIPCFLASLLPSFLTMAPIRYRNLRWDDYARCRGLMEEAFTLEEMTRFVPAWHTRKSSASFVAYSYDTILGFALVNADNYIEYITVHPQFQGYGIGSRLLRRVCMSLSDARSILLKTANDWTLPTWYARHGFEEVCSYVDDDYEFVGMLMIRRQRCRSATLRGY
jgi:GNAT superfamily N-acetyltransferase